MVISQILEMQVKILLVIEDLASNRMLNISSFWLEVSVLAHVALHLIGKHEQLGRKKLEDSAQLYCCP